MAEKAKVSQEVAAAFEHLKVIRYYLNENELLIEHVEAFQTSDWFGTMEALNCVDVLTFARMLINGYEIEVSKDE
jgi:hypothetical protein